MTKSGKTKKELISINSLYFFLTSVAIQFLVPEWIPLMVLFRLGSYFGFGFIVLTWSKYDKVFKACDLRVGQAVPIFKYKTKNEYSTVYHFTLPAGLCLDDFEKKLPHIQSFIGKDIDIKYTYKEITIEEFNKKMAKKIPYQVEKIHGHVPILIGYDKHGERVVCDLGNGEPHMLIGGESGGGKTTALRAMITNLIVDSNVHLYLVDLKNGVEFKIFEKSDRVLAFCRTLDQVDDLLTHIVDEVNRRYDDFYACGVKDIEEYNALNPKNKMDYQVFIMDEFADLVGDKYAMACLDEIGRKARACGIHMILSTQRPDAKVLNGNIKNNMPTVLGFKTKDATNSCIILGTKGLEKLNGKGNGLFMRDGKTIEIQAPLLSQNDAEELIKPTFTEFYNNQIGDNNGKVVSTVEMRDHL